MTATPESLLDEVMDNVVAHEECDCLHCDTLRTDIRQAVEAYGRACRIEELQRLSSRWDVRQSIHERIAELEAEG